MNSQSQAAPTKVYVLHARNEAEAVDELQRSNPHFQSVKNYRIVRVRRTFWQRFVNASPKWKVSYDDHASCSNETQRLATSL